MTSGTAYAREPQKELEVFFVDLAGCESRLDAEERRTPRLSAADNERARAMKDERAARLWRAARIATRIVLERAVGKDIRGVPFLIEPGGRPSLAGRGPHFSISHSAEAALIAVARDMPLGVDLELSVRALRMSDDRRRRILAAADRFAACPAFRADCDSDVLAAWVRLEAVAKALGKGIGRLLTEEGVVGGTGEPDASRSKTRVEVRSLPVAAKYIAAIAAPRLPADIEVQELPFDRETLTT